MFIINNKNIFIGLSVIFVLTALTFVFVKGFNWGIDFVGGTITEVQYTESRPEIATVASAIDEAGIKDARIQPTGDLGLIVRTRVLSQEEQDALESALSSEGKQGMEVLRTDSIGPTLGKELRSKAWIAIGTAVIAIILYIAYVFRKVSEPVSSWKYGVVAIIALAHDVIIPAGFFAALGYEIDSLFVVALLAILGLSVNDTIVVFDRIRENLLKKTAKGFSNTVGKSLEQTFVRSINTSATVLIVLAALYFVGPEATKHFVLALALGMFFGTYSSIFLASPLLTVFAGKRA